ncbi:hypothetical protein SASPL_101094 [Salvia splendens]|uniref:Disease resistance protein RPM1 n=1 Tax=Salvia splendens TaxID=180675 RepID=A0A8X8YRA0_SALSN|nr:hypothetical protein SASPL_101094 [Salvia splendens]
MDEYSCPKPHQPFSRMSTLYEDAQQLQRTLGMIQAYLNDAEKKSITQDAVKIWLRELEAVAFDADNVLDELNYHLLHKKVNKMKSSKDKVTKKASDGVENKDDILEKLQEALKARVESRDDILEKLQEALKGKTYLLVLDDVSKWEDFINSISTNGNCIIITTRSEKVASIVNPFHFHHLKGLSDEDCWSIIKVKTFDENGEVPSRFEMIGRKIAKRCQGMPLAAHVVGGVLRGKSEEEWRFINENWFSNAKGVAMKDDYGNVESCVMHDLASSVVSNNADDSIVVRYKFLEEESSPIPKNVAKHLLTLFLKGGIPVGKEKGFQIEELGSLKNLTGSVEIQDLEMVHDKEEALKANIFQKPNLFKLAFRWSDGREDETNDESVLEGIQPHSNLKKLEISGFKGIRFPTWDEKMVARDGPQGSLVPLDNLIGIELIGCSEIEEIPTLEHLPNLKSVSLKRLKKVRLINAWFNHLTSLQIEELDRLDCLPEWILYNNQNLSFLYISKCGVLRELPDGFIT